MDQILAQEAQTEDWLLKAAKTLRKGFAFDQVGSGRYYILNQIHPRRSSEVQSKPVVDSEALEGSDRSNSLIGTGIPLRHHLDGVTKQATQFAERLGLPWELRDDIGLAAYLHDIGKVDPRFQSRMVGNDPVERVMLEEPLAKSLPGAKRVPIIPGTPRHEITSIAMLESVPEALAGAHDRDLVLHLVATHHGWGRPFLDVVPDNDPQDATFDFEGLALSSTANPASGSLALDMADRFWRLIERYGYHGLAWLEAILRLADHRQSEVEAEE